MSYFAPSAECRRLYNFNPALRFGVAHLPGQGRVFALVQLMDPAEIGGADPTKRRSLSFTIDQVEDWIGLQDKNGRVNVESFGSKIPVILQWCGQRFGNAAIMNGDFVSAVIYQSKPNYVYESERRETIRQSGRDMDNLVRAEADDVSDYHRFLGRDGANSDKLLDREDIKSALKTGVADEFLRVRERDYSVSFEKQALDDAGLK